MLHTASALCLTLLAAAPAPAQPGLDRPGVDAPADSPVMGVVRSVGPDSLSITSKTGKTETTFAVAKDAEITCDGKKCDLKDVSRAGVAVTVTARKVGQGWVAVKIEAQSTEPNRDTQR